MAPRQKVNGLLEEERQALAATNTRIEAISRSREEQLLTGDEDAIDRLDMELGTLGRLAKRHGDRVRLLEIAAKQEEAERVAKRKRELIERIERKLAASNDVAVEIQNLVGQLDKAFQKLVALRLDCAAAWPFDTNALNACALTGASVQNFLRHELYRQGARPFVGGHEFAPMEVSLPGGRAPDVLTRQPELVTPLVEVLRAASDHASQIMRGAIVAAPAVEAIIESASEPPPAALTRATENTGSMSNA
jgi:hypothetical protein